LLDAEARFQCLETPAALQLLGQQLRRWAQGLPGSSTATVA
jgi:hypothetical protein